MTIQLRSLSKDITNVEIFMATIYVEKVQECKLKSLVEKIFLVCVLFTNGYYFPNALHIRDCIVGTHWRRILVVIMKRMHGRLLTVAVQMVNTVLLLVLLLLLLLLLESIDQLLLLLLLVPIA